jgi:hypothetical protein
MQQQKAHQPRPCGVVADIAAQRLQRAARLLGRMLKKIFLSGISTGK